MKEISTHYDNLKVSRQAPPEVIKAAYKALTQKYHPDRNPGDEDALRITALLNGSYEVLIDPVKRQHHDQWIAARESEGAEGQEGPEGIEEGVGPLKLSRRKPGITASLLAFSRRRPLLTAVLPGVLVASILSGVMLAQDRDTQRLREAQWVAWLTHARQAGYSGSQGEAAAEEDVGPAQPLSPVAEPEEDSVLPEPVIITPPTTSSPSQARGREGGGSRGGAHPDASTLVLAKAERAEADAASTRRAGDAGELPRTRAAPCASSGDSPAFQELIAEKHSLLLYRHTKSDCGGWLSREVFDIVGAGARRLVPGNEEGQARREAANENSGLGR